MALIITHQWCGQGRSRREKRVENKAYGTSPFRGGNGSVSKGEEERWERGKNPVLEACGGERFRKEDVTMGPIEAKKARKTEKQALVLGVRALGTFWKADWLKHRG